MLPVPASLKPDALNSTRLYSGNESDFMEMTTCVGGLVSDEPESPIMSPALEQENNVDHGRRDVGLVDALNKSTYLDDEAEESDLSLTCCVGAGVVVCCESAPATSVSASYAPTTDGSMNRMAVIGKDDSDMMTTRCFSSDMSLELGSDMELTECLPSDVSASTTKSSSRWPFGKRPDGRRDRVARFEDNRTSASVSDGDEKPFLETDDLDVSVKMDTAAFLMELDMTEEPIQLREVELSSAGKIGETFSTSSTTCLLSSAIPASVPSCPGTITPSVTALMPDHKPPDKRPTGQSSEFSGKTTDEVVDECEQFVSGSFGATAAAGYEREKSADSMSLCSDMELTQCLPSDVSASSMKSLSRWPFGKLPDGRRGRVARFEDNRTSASVSDGDKKLFLETDDLDVSVKIETAAFLGELDKTEEPFQVREVESSSGSKIGETFSTSSSTCLLSSAIPASVPSCPGTITSSVTALMPDHKPPDKLPTGQSSEFSGKTAGEVVDEREQFVSGSSGATAAAGYQRKKSADSRVEFSEVSVGETDSSLIKSDVKQHRQMLAGFPTECASKTEHKPPAACSGDEEVVFASSSVSASLPSVVNHMDRSVVSWLGKSSSEELEHFSRSAEDALNVYDVSSSVARPVQFGVSAIEKLFAAKESDDILPNNSASVENASVATAKADHMRIMEPEKLRDSPCAGRSAVVDTGLSGLGNSASTEPTVNSLTEARKLRKSAVPNIVQPADDLLTRVKLANSMPYQTTSSMSAHHSFRLVHSAAKQNSTSAFKAVNKSLPLSSHRHSYLSNVFQQYEPPLETTKELGRDVDFFGCSYSQLGISDDSSRMGISAQPMELTDTLPTSLVSFSLTEHLDATKREEMQLQPIRSLKPPSPEPQSISLWVYGRENNVETSVAGNIDLTELSTSITSSSQPLLPVMTMAVESSTLCPSSTTATTTDCAASLSDQHSQFDVMKKVKNLSLAYTATGSFGGMGTEVQPVVVAQKSSLIESGDNLSLATTDISQSSVFCSMESDTSRTGNACVTSQDVGPACVSNGQVCVESYAFGQLCNLTSTCIVEWRKVHTLYLPRESLLCPR